MRLLRLLPSRNESSIKMASLKGYIEQRKAAWLAVIMAAAEDGGTWYNNTANRAALPGAQYLSDAQVKKTLRKMEADGLIVRVARGHYTIPTEEEAGDAS